ncbi:MAG: F0F1 ATP synthase subunit delta [Patescibacteria group bacterium]
MSLATAYASVIKDAEKEPQGGHFVQKLLSLMHARGHMSLLPEIVRILEKEPVEMGAVVTVAHDADVKKFASEIKSALALLGADKETHQTIVDARAVGGYTVRAGSKILDQSFRTALVDLYQNTIRS